MRAVFLALPLLGLGVPATAQSMDHSNMPGMQMPGMKMGSKPAAKPKAKPKTSVSSASRKRSAPRRRRRSAALAPSEQARGWGEPGSRSPCGAQHGRHAGHEHGIEQHSGRA
jgi:copper resistance protein B